MSFQPKDFELVESVPRSYVDGPNKDGKKSEYKKKLEHLDSELIVMTYNVFGTSSRVRGFPRNVGRTWLDVRMELFEKEMCYASFPSIVCLQDVEMDHEGHWYELLFDCGLLSQTFYAPGKALGITFAWDAGHLLLEEIEPVFFDEASSQQDGCFGLVANAAITQGPVREELVIATAKLCDRPDASYERLCQLTQLLKAAHQKYKKYSFPCDDCYLVIPADFNSDESSPLYQIFVNHTNGLDCLPELTNSVLSACKGDVEQAQTKAQELVDQAIATRDKFRPLRSVYKSTLGEEPLFTRWSEKAKGTYDYILVTDNFKINAVLEPLPKLPRSDAYDQPFTLPYIRKVGWVEGAPSDHIPIVAQILPIEQIVEQDESFEFL